MSKQAQWKVLDNSPLEEEVDLVEDILEFRGFEQKEIKKFLNPDLDRLHQPTKLAGMTKAVMRIKKAIKNEEEILIFGDYDVDGITSTSLLKRMFEKEFDKEVDYYIPNRLKEGYGLNAPAIRNIAKKNVDLVITVDCGIKANEEVELANELGMDVIITDHHTPPETLPNAVSVINPKLGDYPFEMLAGVGVAFKLLQALVKKPIDELVKYMDIVTLGTIADMVPMQKENRIISYFGLQVMNKKSHNLFNIQELIEEKIGKGKDINSGKVSYQLAPVINACGRLGKGEAGVELFASNEAEVVNTIKEVIELNEKRKEISADIFDKAEKYIRENELENDKVIIIPLKEAHKGVIGNVASDLQEKYYRPIILFSFDEKDSQDNYLGTGSARSIKALNLYNALEYCEDYLENFGGHSQAAGCTILESNLDKFREKMIEFIENNLKKEDLQPVTKVDKVLENKDIIRDNYDKIEEMRPFGIGNPRPKFILENVILREFSTFGRNSKDHLRAKFIKGKDTFPVIAWGMADRRKELLEQSYNIDLLFQLDINDYRNNNHLQLNLKDFRLPEISFDEKLFYKEQERRKGIEDYYSDYGKKNEFYQKITGIGKVKGDYIKSDITGELRQDVIANDLEVGDELKFLRYYRNEYDENAIILVKDPVGMDNQEILDKIHNDKIYPDSKVKDVGYIKARLSKYIAPFMDKGVEYQCIVTAITGKDNPDYDLGVNILVTKETREPKVIKEEREEEKLKYKGLSKKELMQIAENKVIGEENTFWDYQEKMLNHLNDNKNTLGVVPTGGGKSAVFQSLAFVKAMHEDKTTIITYPLKALAHEQYHFLKEEMYPLKVELADGTLNFYEKHLLYEEVANDEIDILIATPEFVDAHREEFKPLKDNVGLFVVDEAHYIGKATENFRKVYKNIDDIIDFFGNPLTLGVTATLANEVSDPVIDTLDIKSTVIDDTIRDNMKMVDLRNKYAEDEKIKYLDRLVQNDEKSIIYLNSRHGTFELAQELKRRNPDWEDKIAFFHSEVDDEDKKTIAEKFLEGEYKFMIATSAFGEGINNEDVRHVVLYHMNFNWTSFNQMCGRVGRDGETAWIHLLYNQRDVDRNRFILENRNPSRNSLATIYKALYQIPKSKLKRKKAVETLSNNLEFDEDMIDSGLETFVDLGLITIGDTIEFQEEITEVDLEESVRYIEGERARELFEEFQKFALYADKKKLLKNVNKAIYPSKLHADSKKVKSS